MYREAKRYRDGEIPIEEFWRGLHKLMMRTQYVRVPRGCKLDFSKPEPENKSDNALEDL